MLLPLSSLTNAAGNYMARAVRKKSGTGIYHVMLRGINRQDIFEDEEDYQQMVSILRYIHQNPLKACIVGHIDDYSWSSWNEYKAEGNPKAFCSTRAVFSRIPREELKELINTPVEGGEHILDIDTDGSRLVSDSDVKAFLLDRQGIANPLMVQSLEKTRRNEVLRSALSFGTGIRQLSRQTGVSFGVIQKLAK